MQLRGFQRLPGMGSAAFGIEPPGMGRDVAEQTQRQGCEARLALRGCDRALAKAARLIEPAEQQTGATRRVVSPAPMGDDSPCRLTLEELLTLSHAAQRLAGLADLSQRPGRGGDRPGKKNGDI